MNDWVYDLQRFAEGDAAQSTEANTSAASEGNELQEGASAGAGTPPAVEETAEDRLPAGGFAIQVDPATGARTVVEIKGEEDDGTPQAEGALQQTQDAPTAPVAPVAYNANELLAALTTGMVDESRISDDLRPYYVAIRQQQQIAALTAQQYAQQQTMQMPQVPQQDAQVPTPQQTDLYRRIQNAAEEKALQDLGITRESLADLSYADSEEGAKKAEEFRVAVQMNVNAITREIDAYQMELRQQQAEAQAFMQEFAPKIQQVQREEPNFNQIDLMMENFYQQLPYQEAVQVAAAVERYKNGTCTRADIPVLESYYNKTRAAFYAKQTGISPTPQPAPKAAPPQVEGAGKVAPNAPDQVDWRAIRAMSVRERNEFLRAHLH